MATDTFRRHTRACVDFARSRAYAELPPAHHPRFERLSRIVRERSDLMATPPTREGRMLQIDALANLAAFDGVIRAPEEWTGATGHPLRVVHSLASHLFGRYATPRFLASVWFGDARDRHAWFVAHASGQKFRSLALPIAMTRRMEHVFLRTPDHVTVDHALRRAEVLGLGGSEELAAAVIATRLGEQFDDPERWRRVLAWLVGCTDVDLTHVRPFVDFAHARLLSLELTGRTFTSVMRLVRVWHGEIARERMRYLVWPRSRWRELVLRVAPTPSQRRPAEWTIVELLDSRELSLESRAMKHCVAIYARACARRHASIWSLRHRWCDEPHARSVLTIEVRPSTGMIVQLRGKANARPSGMPLQIVRMWAQQQSLPFHHYVRTADGVV